MRGIRFLGLGLLAAVLAGSPGITHAASYRHFTSRSLHFAIDYPSNWSAQYSRAKAFETFELGNSVALTVNYHSPGGLNIRSFTTRVRAGLRSIGVTSKVPVYSGNVGQFSGSGKVAGYQVVVGVVTTITSHGAYSLTAATPKSRLSRINPLFTHMIHSFKSM